MKKLLCVLLALLLMLPAAYAEEKEVQDIFGPIYFEAAKLTYGYHSVKVNGYQYEFVVSFLFKSTKKGTTYFAHEFEIEAYQNGVKCIPGYISLYAQEPYTDVLRGEEQAVRVVFEIDNPDDDVTVKIKSIGSNKDTDTYFFTLKLNYTGARF